MEPKPDELLASIDRKLTILVYLGAYRLAGEMTIAEGAPVLKRLGLSPAEIAAVFDSTVNTVKVRLAEAKKKARAGKAQ